VVVLDGNFPTPTHRSNALAAATAANVRCFVAHLDVDAATAIARAAARTHAATDISDANADITASRRAGFVSPSDAEGIACTQLDGTLPSSTLAARSFAAMLHTPR
jgi:predicted kinase